MAWSDIFLPAGYQTSSEAQANADRQAAQLKDVIAARDSNILYDQSGASERDLAAINGSQNYASDQNAAASSGFVEGLGDGLSNIKGAVTGFGPFKLIPIWVWITVPIALFFYLGGLPWLKNKLK